MVKHLVIILLLFSCVSSKKIVTLDLSGSYDPDGHITMRTWHLVNGTLIAPADKIITQAIVKNGTIIQLIVVDNNGAADTLTVTYKK